MSYLISDHAREEAQRRGISIEIIEQIMVQPGQIVDAHSGRQAYQSQITIDDKLYLVRVFVEDTDPKTVVTVYRTSKIKKYWSEDR